MNNFRPLSTIIFGPKVVVSRTESLVNFTANVVFFKIFLLGTVIKFLKDTESAWEIITPRKVVFLAVNIFEFAVHVQKLHKYINSSQHFVCLEAKRCSRIRITYYIKGLELDRRL